jgi:hypothetical protein
VTAVTCVDVFLWTSGRLTGGHLDANEKEEITMRDDSRSTDHCRHGDHEVCERWFRDVCRCWCHGSDHAGEGLTSAAL